MDMTLLIRDGRTYLPATYVAQVPGYTASWDDQSKTMTITQAYS
jgi:hypothetical protein